MLFTFAPRKTRKVRWEIVKKVWENEAKKKFQKFLNFSCEKQKEYLVLHPLWETNQGKWNKKYYVRRHIELTAVLTEMLEQKNKSNGIDRFDKNR